MSEVSVFLCRLSILKSLLINCNHSSKLIDVYRTRHNISASSGFNDPAVATGISDLVYELREPDQKEPYAIDPDLANAWAANLEDDFYNAPAMSRVSSTFQLPRLTLLRVYLSF